MDKPWWESGLNALMGILEAAMTRKALAQAGADPHAVAGALTMHIDLGSGYSVEAERASRAALLRAACDATINDPAWRPGQPNPGDTHCNGGAAQIARAAYAYHALDGKVADQQIQILASDPDWRQDSMERASAHAQKGGLAFATIMGYPHGHIAAIYPDPMEQSETWGELVPIIANVGHENKRCRLSGGFLSAQRPAICFYLYKPESVA